MLTENQGWQQQDQIPGNKMATCIEKNKATGSMNDFRIDTDIFIVKFRPLTDRIVLFKRFASDGCLGNDMKFLNQIEHLQLPFIIN